MPVTAMKHLLLRLTLGAAALSAALAHADDVAFTSFGPGQSYINYIAYGIFGPTSSFGHASYAWEFTAGTSGDLSSVSFAGLAFSPGTLDVALYADSGHTLGASLESFSVPISSNSASVITLTSLSHPALVAGQKYWFAQKGEGNGAFGWMEASTGQMAPFAYQWDSASPYYGPDDHIAAFQVNTVPEPGSIATLGLGAVALLRRRKSRA